MIAECLNDLDRVRRLVFTCWTYIDLLYYGSLMTFQVKSRARKGTRTCSPTKPHAIFSVSVASGPGMSGHFLCMYLNCIVCALLGVYFYTLMYPATLHLEYSRVDSLNYEGCFTTTCTSSPLSTQSSGCAPWYFHCFLLGPFPFLHSPFSFL